VKAIEIIHIHREALDALPFSPGPNIHRRLPLTIPFMLKRPTTELVVDHIFCASSRPLTNSVAARIHGSGMNPVVDALHELDFLMTARAPLQDDRQRERAKENQAEENRIQSRSSGGLNLANIRKGQRTQQENSGLPHEPAPKCQFGCGRGQPQEGHWSVVRSEPQSRHRVMINRGG